MQNEQNQIFIGNLAFITKNDELEEIFGKFGNILKVAIPTDRDSGRPRGFAFITFDSQQAAQDALSVNGQEINGRPVKVNMATSGKKRGSGGRGGSAGGGKKW